MHQVQGPTTHPARFLNSALLFLSSADTPRIPRIERAGRSPDRQKTQEIQRPDIRERLECAQAPSAAWITMSKETLASGCRPHGTILEPATATSDAWGSAVECPHSAYSFRIVWLTTCTKVHRSTFDDLRNLEGCASAIVATREQCAMMQANMVRSFRLQCLPYSADPFRGLPPGLQPE